MASDVTQAEKTWIQKTPNVCGGDACVRDTRIPVWSVVRAHQLGASKEKLQTYFVTPLSAADLDAVFEYYRLNAEEIDTDIRLNEECWSTWFKKLDELKARRDAWAGGKAGPPNDVSIKNANVFLECLQQSECPPKQIVPSVVGGVGVTLRQAKKKVYVEFTNKGSVNALFSDGETNPAVEQIQPGTGHYFTLIEKAKAYLHE